MFNRKLICAGFIFLLISCETTTEKDYDFEAKVQRNVSKIVCGWDKKHNICMCGMARLAMNVEDSFAWDPTTQFYAPDTACFNEQ